MFDWLAYEDRLWELAGKLKKAFEAAPLKLGKNKMQHAFESAKFTLVEMVDSTLLALRRKIHGSATQEEVSRVREAARVLSRFIVRHGEDGLKGMEEEQKRATQAHLDKLPELHLKEFETRIKKFGMDLDSLEQLISRDKLKKATDSANAMRANTT